MLAQAQNLVASMVGVDFLSRRGLRLRDIGQGQVYSQRRRRNERRKGRRERDTAYRRKKKKPGNWKTWLPYPRRRVNGKLSQQADRLRRLTQSAKKNIEQHRRDLKTMDERMCEYQQKMAKADAFRDEIIEFSVAVNRAATEPLRVLAIERFASYVTRVHR